MMLRRRALAILGLVGLCGVGRAEAQTPVPFPFGVPIQATWTGAENEAISTTRYELRVDGGAWVTHAQSLPQVTYVYVIPEAQRAIGAHTLDVRGCGVSGCGPMASVAYEIMPPLPGVPRHLSIVPGPVASLTLPQAERYAQAFALWRIDRDLTPTELGWLAARWPSGQAITKVTLINFLDGAPWP
jgi:hypothetical protein